MKWKEKLRVHGLAPITTPGRRRERRENRESKHTRENIIYMTERWESTHKQREGQETITYLLLPLLQSIPVINNTDGDDKRGEEEQN
jgi:hypothetical protein